VLSRFVVIRTFVAALLMTAGAVGQFQWEYREFMALGAGGSRALAEALTMAVTAAIMFQIVYLQSCRSLRESIFRIGVACNPWIFAGTASLLILQAAFVCAPPAAGGQGAGTSALGPARRLPLSFEGDRRAPAALPPFRLFSAAFHGVIRAWSRS